MEAIDAVVKPLVDSAVGALDTAAGSVLGALGLVLLSPEKLGGGQGDVPTANDKLCCDANGHEITPEPAPASGGAGKGVKGGKKDRSDQGNVDQLEGLQHLQKTQTQRGGYRISDKKSKQNIDNANKKIKSLEDIENQ